MPGSDDCRRASQPHAVSGAAEPTPECRCRCDWCRDRRYYTIPHLAGPERLPVRGVAPEDKALHERHGLGDGSECHARRPCGCHCPHCHHREAHYSHFHLFRLNWDCPAQSAALPGQGWHSHGAACRELPWRPTDGLTAQPVP